MKMSWLKRDVTSTGKDWLGRSRCSSNDKEKKGVVTEKADEGEEVASKSRTRV